MKSNPDFTVCVDSPWPTRPPKISPATSGATWMRRPWRW